MSKRLFPTSVVGSMPRSDFVKDLIAAAPDEISNEDYEQRMDAAVRYIIAVQEQAGLDVTPGNIDSPEVIAERVRMVVRHIAPERITLNPDCGFAPGSGAVVGIDEAYEKLCNEVAAATILREEFS